MVDDNPEKYSVDVLASWKEAAERLARSSLEFPPSPEAQSEPNLTIPTTEASVSWLAFSSTATRHVGRESEVAQLTEFLRTSRPFSWWAVTGAGGTGKSRLALEICKQIGVTWHTGFLSRTNTAWIWSKFRPVRPTLIVIDYVNSRAHYVSDLILELQRIAPRLEFPVRVLLLERDVESSWPVLTRAQSFSENAALLASQHDIPLELPRLSAEALKQIATDILRMRKGEASSENLARIESRVHHLDPQGRPLFGMIAAESLDTAGEEAGSTTVLRQIVGREVARWRDLSENQDQFKRMRNLVFLATLVGGIPIAAVSRIAAEADDALLPRAFEPVWYNDLVGAGSERQILTGLQPDMLGERLVLDRFDESPDSSRRLLEIAWTLEPDGLAAFIVRSAEDFPSDKSLDALLQLPTDSAEKREVWGKLVATLVRLAASSSDKRTNILLDGLRALHRRYPLEVELADGLALAELFLGNVYLLIEKNLAQAASQFETALRLASPVSHVRPAATNNRGILYHRLELEDQAFADWTTVIDMTEAPDEARAAALNNRADIHTRRDDHEDSIRDRSEVLRLRETSPDRRYIALARRSRTFAYLRRWEAALEDLEQIFASPDISTEQKTEALLTRGQINIQRREFQAAEADLRSVLADDALFEGVAAEALVQLAKLARLIGNVQDATTFLSSATALPDVTERTLVEAQLEEAAIHASTGRTPAANDLWESITQNPSATRRQATIARNRGQGLDPMTA